MITPSYVFFGLVRLDVRFLLAILCGASVVGCSHAVAAPARSVPVISATECNMVWSKQPAEELAGGYEWIGEVILDPTSDMGIDAQDRKLVEQRACSIGGQLLTLTTHDKRKGTSYASNGTLVFDVLRARGPRPAEEAPLLPAVKSDPTRLTIAAPVAH